MNSLKVKDYNQAEQECMAMLPVRVIQAFQPITFREIGYPVHIRRESELFKYVDVMHEQRFENDFQNLFGGGLRVEEFELLKRVTEWICRFSESRFGKKAIARGSVLRALNVMRHIKYVHGDKRPTVFEIGPGCGYLGAMLILEGYPYAGTDISQAFYLYQNHFWNFITDGKVTELAEHGNNTEALAEVSPKSALHIPWWKFFDANFLKKLPSFDIITCNHVLCEMHPESLGYNLRIAHDVLKSNGTFLFEGWGLEKVNLNIESVTSRFHQFGFSLIHNDQLITAFTPSNGDNAHGALVLPRKVTQNNIVLQNEQPVLVKSQRDSFNPGEYTSTHNPVSRSILSGRTEEARPVGIEEVNQFYTDLLGSEDHRSPDEVFWELIGHPKG
ncbi:class I SAM-dependent methyltransferase [bacterium]|nr:class I SAM-dependent methyltransferase [bacterium]